MTSDGLETPAAELKRLRAEVAHYRKVLWVLAREAPTMLMVSNRDLITIPDEAELLSWDDPLYDAVIFKGICNTINQPNLAKPVHDPQGQRRGLKC